MAKFTRIELTPDDPIFHQGVQMFVPVSRPKGKDNPANKSKFIKPRRPEQSKTRNATKSDQTAIIIDGDWANMATNTTGKLTRRESHL